jgi:hypothetical protein
MEQAHYLYAGAVDNVKRKLAEMEGLQSHDVAASHAGLTTGRAGGVSGGLRHWGGPAA